VSDFAEAVSEVATQAGPRVRAGEPHIDPAFVPELERAHDRGGPDALARALPASMVQGLTAAAHQTRPIIGLFS